MDLGKYLKIGLRWWWLILFSVALSTVASYIYTQRLPKLYAARTTMMVGASIIENTNPNERDLGLSRTLAEVYAELTKRKPITQAVIDRLGLEMTSDQLVSMIQTSVIYNAQLLEIIVIDVHPRRAQLLANTIGEELILQSPTGSGNQQEQDKFIRDQLAELQIKIEDANIRIKEVEDNLTTLTSAVEIAEAQSKLTELEKLKQDYQANYTQFLSNLSESSINRLAIFEPAVEPTFPVGPNVRINVLVAAVR
jgi:capsular polysaccharide biosynthesis protein